VTRQLVERVICNADILLHPSGARARALAIGGGRVLAAGDDHEILPLAGAGAKIENANGRSIIPGLIDAHIHWQMYAASLFAAPLFGLRSMRDALQVLAQRAAQLPPGEWLFGYGWAQDEWEERAFPTAAQLDSVVPDRPAFLRARSGHAAWVNSVALRLAGIDAHTAVPEGSEILRDDRGQPTGILLEWDAMALVERVIPPRTIEDTARQMRAAQQAGLAMGMTGFHDFDNQDALAALQLLRERDALALRVLKNVNKAYLDSLLHMGLRFGFGDAWIRIGALKLFADGALGPHTAWMLEPYLGEPENTGIVVVPPEEMLRCAALASAAGLPTTIHAIGDRAVREVLDVFAEVRRQEAVRGVQPAQRRHRIEHVQLIAPADAGRLAQLDLIASMQPIHATSDYPVADRAWGAARVPWSYNPRLQLDRGAMLAFGSDAPFDSPGPLRGIHAAVTRRRADGTPGPEGRTPAAKVTVQEALTAYTLGPAYAAGLEAVQGQLMPGFLADLVVLDRDLYACAPDALAEVQVLGTMVDGVWRYGGLE
jgi:predicted amidohydrolase YtcJ